MKRTWPALLCAFIACGAPTPTATPTTEDESEVLARKYTLSVRVRGAGSVLGAVHSSPAGIACVLDSSRPDRECRADFARRQPIRLTYSPGGAGMLAQFSILRGSTWESCPAPPASAGLACELVLTADTQVQVFPISIPPPLP